MCAVMVFVMARDVTDIHGDLQLQLMGVLWRLGSGTVDEVRSGLPPRYRGAYTTVQTVLNRLVERGALDRNRQGAAYLYRPRLSEADFVTRSIERTLSSASADARRTALAQLVGGLDRQQLEELQDRARQIAPRRKGRRA